ENRAAFREMFDGWAKDLMKQPGAADEAAFASFRESMYGGGLGLSGALDFVPSCTPPMIVLRGDDLYHPAPVSDEIVRLNPKIEMIQNWKTPEAAPAAVKRVREFMKAHQR